MAGRSGEEWDRPEPLEGDGKADRPRPASWQVEPPPTSRASEPAGQAEQPSAQRLRRDDPLAQPDPGGPVGEVMGDDLHREPGPVGGEPARREVVESHPVLARRRDERPKLQCAPPPTMRTTPTSPNATLNQWRLPSRSRPTAVARSAVTMGPVAPRSATSLALVFVSEYTKQIWLSVIPRTEATSSRGRSARATRSVPSRARTIAIIARPPTPNRRTGKASGLNSPTPNLMTA